MSCLATALALCTAIAAPGYVVDGDTIRTDDGVYLRLLELDTPEKGHRAGCEAERVQAEKASEYLKHLLANGFVVEDSGDRGRYGRPLVHLRLPDGRTASQAMVDVGLGVVYEGRMHEWCE